MHLLNFATLQVVALESADYANGAGTFVAVLVIAAVAARIARKR